MNYLQLLQALHREAGVAGSAPASVTGLSGMPAKLAAWIAAAWTEIQSARRWSFLLTEADVSLVSGQQDYDLVTDWTLQDVRELDRTWGAIMLPDGSDKSRLGWLPYPNFRDAYGLGDPQDGRPQYVTVVRGNLLRFNARPDQAYKARLSYYLTAESLAANADVPSLAAEERWVIVWKALMLYAAHEGAPEVFADAQAKYRAAFSLLCQRYLPDISLGGALV